MNSKKLNLYILCLIILILDGAHSLITFVFLPGYRTLLGLLTMCLFAVIYPSKKKFTLPAILIYAFTAFGVVIGHRGDVSFSFISRLPILTLFMLKLEDLKIVADRIEKFFFVVISASFIIYVLTNFLNVPLPSRKVVYNQYELQNYYYIYTSSLNYGFKFSGFTLEPGYFSLLCICLLALNEFNFKNKSSYIYVVSILFSLSLEGYILLVVGLIISAICREGRVSNTIKYTLIIIGLIVVSIFIALKYNGGENAVGEYIIDRLVLDQEKGIVGNNRESIAAEIVIDPVFYSNRVWLGIGETEFYDLVFGLDMCSWRAFVLIYGAIYTIFLFFISIIGLRRTVVRKTIPFFVIFWMDFIPHGGPFFEVMYFLIIIFLLNLKEYNKKYLQYKSKDNTNKQPILHTVYHSMQ